MKFQIYGYEEVKQLLNDREAIVCRETAAIVTGLSVGVSDNSISVYALEELDIEGVECDVVASFEDIPHEEFGALKVTTAERTIIDILRINRNLEVIYTSLATYYHLNGESFDKLNIPKDLKGTFNYYSAGAIEYYSY